MKKRYAMLGGIVLSLVLLTGCGGKKELEAQIASLQSINADLESRLGTNQTITYNSSLINIEGSGEKEYVTIDNMIKFPNDMGVIYTEDDVASSYLRIGSIFNYSPSNNWDVQIEGSEAKFSHPQKVWGSIKSIKVENTATEDPLAPEVLEGINNFFRDQPITNRKDRRIYMGENHRGYLASGKMVVDKKNYVVNVGGVIYGEYGSLYLFVYEDNQSGIQQELIDLLIGSGRYADTQVLLQ